MKKLIIGISSIAVISGLVIGGAMANSGSATTSSPPDLTPQVQAQQTQLDNHEARITNTENDVKDLQSSTNTPPSVAKVDVPIAQAAPVLQQTAQAPTIPEPTSPTPVTVTAYEQIPVEGSEDVDCKYTYSDGTNYQWHWQKVEYNQGSKITNTSGLCDNRAIGHQDRPN